MQTENLIREFRYNGARLADPSPAFSLQQVRDFYGNTYPEIVNAEIEGPEVIGNRNVYTFRRAVGTKGAALTLEQVRADIEGGVFRNAEPNLISLDDAGSALMRRLHAALAINTSGAALRAPVFSMPVLP
ncbi:PRTRC system protein C [Paraburkholderia sp. GAS82]|uniref:PRTRC system protein C n=1 Tax=Paraburkholderia sp. GAS82 TaxID=3035137 RepID=UPI003D24CB57